MADNTRKQQPAPVSAHSRHRATMVLWVSVAVMALLVFSLPTVIVLCFGMLPSLGAYAIDQSKEKYATFCVASINFCGVFPYLMDLWFGTHTLYAATLIMADVFALFVMFGSAAVGWVLFSTVPSVISSFISVLAQQRVNSLRAQQKTLIEEWGEAVVRRVETKAAAKPAQAGNPSTKASKPKTNGGASGAPGNQRNTTPQAAA